MNDTLDVLLTLAEITVVFVAFAVIVAAIRITFGEKLARYQILLVHFFTEGGMLVASFALVTVVLYQFFPDELHAATIATWYCLLTIAAYLLTYLYRRGEIKAPTPLLSVLNIAVWFIWVIVLALTLSELFWLPSFAIIAGLTLWGLASTTIIFISFLNAILDIGNASGADEKPSQQDAGRE